MLLVMKAMPGVGSGPTTDVHAHGTDAAGDCVFDHIAGKAGVLADNDLVAALEPS
jgi:hypothetical protein